MTDVPASHPRYASLRTRDAIVAGVEKGVTSIHGLIAHGRGEAFDYLLGERTRDFAREAIDAAAAMLVTAARPVVSVNGNAAALVPGELAALADALDAPLEVNIFHASKERELAIREHMRAHGARDVLMPTEHAVLDHIDSNRRFVNPDGIYAQGKLVHALGLSAACSGGGFLWDFGLDRADEWIGGACRRR